jgi:hypothetical protein
MPRVKPVDRQTRRPELPRQFKIHSVVRPLLLVILTALLLPALAGCEAFYMLNGKGTQDALYAFPVKSRVLVMVDTRPNSGVPADAPPALAEALTQFIFQHQKKGKECEFVSPARLAGLRSDPDKFHLMSISDIAAATNADYVLYVDLAQFTLENTPDGSVTQGVAQTLTKVISRHGARVYPTDGSAGIPIASSLTPGLADPVGQSYAKDQLLDQLTVRIGRMFISYDMEDNSIARP